MKWYSSSDSNGIVISTRVRLARNISEYPFAPKMSQAQKSTMIKEIKEVFEKYGTDRYNYVDVASKSDTEKLALVEEHLISPEFAQMPKSESRMLIYDENGNVSVMAGEEDHLRIQCVKPGFSIREAYESADAVDTMLSHGLKYAFDDKLGYLTCCPSNTGTGMRISCMLHLPMLTRNDYIKSVIEYCTRLGLTVRGFYGEGSKADGEIYQVSNQITLGLSEDDTIGRIGEAVQTIVEKEASLRKQLVNAGIAFQDKLWRSYGIMQNARRMDSSEFLSLWSECMLGKECGIIDKLSNVNMVKILIECMPAHIALNNSQAQDPAKRDELRAEKIRNILEI